MPLLVATQAACSSTSNTPSGSASNVAGEAASGGRVASNGATAGAADANAVQVEVAPARVERGRTSEGVVRVVIAPGFHVNANPATHTYLIPTTLSLRGKEQAGLTLAEPVYPEGVTRKFAFDETPLRVYEGAAEIRLPLRAAQDAPAGERSIPLRVRVQPCDDAACRPPRTIEATLPVTVE